jgi:hypothetical protein
VTDTPHARDREKVALFAGKNMVKKDVCTAETSKDVSYMCKRVRIRVTIEGLCQTVLIGLGDLC